MLPRKDAQNTSMALLHYQPPLPCATPPPPPPPHTATAAVFATATACTLTLSQTVPHPFCFFDARSTAKAYLVMACIAMGLYSYGPYRHGPYGYGVIVMFCFYVLFLRCQVDSKGPGHSSFEAAAPAAALPTASLVRASKAPSPPSSHTSTGLHRHDL